MADALQLGVTEVRVNELADLGPDACEAIAHQAEDALTLYAGCGRLLLEPDDRTRAEVAGGALLDALVEAGQSIAGAAAGAEAGAEAASARSPAESEAARDVARAAAALRDAARAEGFCGPAPATLDDAYWRIFGHALSPDYPPYETQYGEDPVFRQPQRLADVRGFYRAFGVEAPAEAHERADHLGVELEFLALLTAREATAALAGEADGAGTCARAITAFLREHPAPVLPTFRGLLEERAAGPGTATFVAVARLAEATCAWDAARRGVSIPIDDRARLVRVLDPDPEEVEA